MMFLKTKLCTIIFIILIANAVSSANILGLMGIASPSHHIWNSALTHALAKRGHNLTILSVDLPKPEEIPKNAHYIHLEEVYNSMHNSDASLSVKEFIGVGPIEDIPLLYDWGIKECIGVIRSKGFDILLNYPDDFKIDLIIHDYTLGPCLLGFAHKFKYPPIVGVSAFLYPPNTYDLMGGHLFPGYVPFYATASYDIDMNFWERMHNNLIYLLDNLYRNYYAMPKIDKIIRHKYMKGTPYLSDIDRKTTICLVNSHPAINYAESMPPGVIEVGGMQLIDPSPLSKELEEFIGKSKKGAIMFSLGTNMHADDVGPRLMRVIIDTMTQLPDYSFLWKFEKDFSDNELPKNVLVKKFLPQRDILAHPKVKAFITHAGGLSTQEATWYGVPMIGLALFVDQPRNLYKSIKAGVAERVDYLTLSVDSLKTTILKVVENKSYAENMKIRSARFRDRPMKPLDTAVWWAEYVLRNPNPTHLKSPTVNMNYFTANSLDFIFILFSLLFILFSVIVFMVFYILAKKIKKVEEKKKTM